MIHRKDLSESLVVRSHGVSVRIITNSVDAFDAIVPALSEDLPLGEFSKNALPPPGHEFAYFWNPSTLDAVYKDGEKISARRRRADAIKLLCSQIRLTIAEFAPDHVFIHAGVVSVNGKAIILPANSMSGKTTLTAELVRQGTVYLSDEYAVIDNNGNVCPYPKDLSFRPEGQFQQTEIPVGSLGGKQGKRPVPVGLIVFTEFSAKGMWKPEILTPGQAYLEFIPHTIPIRQSPAMSMDRLRMIVSRAASIKTKRGDAKETAAALLEYFSRLK